MAYGCFATAVNGSTPHACAMGWSTHWFESEQRVWEGGALGGNSYLSIFCTHLNKHYCVWQLSQGPLLGLSHCGGRCNPLGGLQAACQHIYGLVQSSADHREQSRTPAFWAKRWHYWPEPSSTARTHARCTLGEWYSGSQYIGTLLHPHAQWMGARCADLATCMCVSAGLHCTSCQPGN